MNSNRIRVVGYPSLRFECSDLSVRMYEIAGMAAGMPGPSDLSRSEEKSLDPSSELGSLYWGASMELRKDGGLTIHVGSGRGPLTFVAARVLLETISRHYIGEPRVLTIQYYDWMDGYHTPHQLVQDLQTTGES